MTGNTLKKKKSKLPVILTLLTLVILIAGGVIFYTSTQNKGNTPDTDTGISSEPDTNSPDILTADRFSNPLEVTDDSVMLESLILSADNTQFYVGETRDITLTVYVPDNLPSGDITICDNSGKSICDIKSSDLSDANDNLNTAQVTLPISSETDGLLFYTAHMGEFRSNTLTIYVTPDITEEQLDQCEQICADLSTYMHDICLQEGITNEDKLKKAEEWISKHEEIAEYKLDNTTIIFSTKDSILGSYTVFEENTFGGNSTVAGSTGTPYSTSDHAIDLFELYQSTGQFSEDGSWEFLNSRNTNTNTNVATLRPLYDDDWRCKVDYHANYGSCIADALGGTHTIRNRDSYFTFARELNQYGTIIYNSHGNILTRADGSSLFYSFLLHCNEGEESYRNQLFQCLVAEDYKDEKEKYTPREYRSLFYGKVSDSDSYRLMYNIAEDNPYIVMTSNYIMDNYRNSFFDNSIIYFGVCYSFCDSRLNTFFINHGAKAYIGYSGAINTDLEKIYFEKIMDTAFEYDTNETYSALNTLNTAMSKSLTFTQEFFLKPWTACWNTVGEGWNALLCLVGLKDSGSHSTQECSALYQTDYTYYGERTLQATIMGYDGDTPVNRFENALVKAYRFTNQQFSEIATVKADEQGNITLENLRFGYYVITITDKYDDVYTISLLYDNQCPDTFEIKLDVTEIGYVESDSFELKDDFIRKVKQQTKVPAGYIGISTEEELYQISADMKGRYILMNDILCDNFATIPGHFEGTLNGNGFSIKNATGPLFEYVDDAKIRSLCIESSENLDIAAILTKYKNYGMLAPVCYDTIIENCHVKGNLTAVLSENITGNASGFVGYGERLTFENCYNEVDISIQASNYGVRSGGLTGDSKESTYYNCYNHGNVSVTTSRHGDTVYSYIPLQTGGISGQVSRCTIQHCYNTGNITSGGGAFTSAQSGGIVGNAANQSRIERCRNEGMIKSDLATTTNMGMVESIPQGFASVGGKEEADELRGNINNINFMFWYSPSTGGIAGGIVGFGTESSLALCTNRGTVSGSYISGGIAGKTRNMNFENAINKGAVSGTFCIGGFVGYLSETNEKTSYINCATEGMVGSAEIYGNFAGVIDLDSTKSTVSQCYYVPYCDNSMAICEKDSEIFTFSSVSTLSQETLSGYDFEQIWTVTGDSVDIRY